MVNEPTVEMFKLGRAECAFHAGWAGPIPYRVSFRSDESLGKSDNRRPGTHRL